jgi:hypothetical protein
VGMPDPRGQWVRLSQTIIAVLAGVALLAPGAGAVVAEVKPLRIGPPQLKLATATVPYTHQLIAKGGTAPYTFTLHEGAPPQGITLSPTGEVSGTPTETGSGTFTVLATDSSTPAMTATRTYTLGVQLDVTPTSIKRTRVSALVQAALGAAADRAPTNSRCSRGPSRKESSSTRKSSHRSTAAPRRPATTRSRSRPPTCHLGRWARARTNCTWV